MLNMKRILLAGAFAALGMILSANVSAQEKASKSEYKANQKYEKTLNKDLKKKAIKGARKEGKQLGKEGFKTLPGKLPIDKQVENAWQKQVEIDTNGNPYWYVASSRAVGGNQQAAAMQATSTAKIDLAGQIQTCVIQLIETKTANNDMGQAEAASLIEAVGVSKNIIAATLSRTIPLVEVYKTLPNKNVEMMVTLAYSTDAANKMALKAMRDELAKKSESLAKELDVLLYY